MRPSPCKLMKRTDLVLVDSSRELVVVTERQDLAIGTEGPALVLQDA